MPPDQDAELPPLEGLDALDEDLAADMLYNRPLYPPAMLRTAPDRTAAGRGAPPAGTDAPRGG